MGLTRIKCSDQNLDLVARALLRGVMWLSKEEQDHTVYFGIDEILRYARVEYHYSQSDKLMVGGLGENKVLVVRGDGRDDVPELLQEYAQRGLVNKIVILHDKAPHVIRGYRADLSREEEIEKIVSPDSWRKEVEHLPKEDNRKILLLNIF